MGPQFTFTQQWVNLLGLLKYGILFAALLLFLPLSALKGVPGHTLTGSMFLDLSFWGVFWAAVFLVMAAWSIMFTEGLIVDGLEARWKADGALHRANSQQQSGYVPGWAEEFFSIPITAPQLVAFSVLAIPGLWVSVQYAAISWLYAMIATVSGIVAVTLLMAVPYARAQPENRNFKAYHVLAAILVAVLLLFLGVIATLFYPGNARGWELPALVYLYILLILLIWTFGALHFQLARWRISPALVLLLIMVVGYSIDNEDHYYQVFTEARQNEKERLTPVAVAKTAADNLVVVTATGGGIQAAGWTTLALEQLITERSQLAREIRLLSTVSGGSVGAAYYLDALLPQDPQKECSEGSVANQLPQGLLEEIRLKSIESSLAAAAYGFAFLDFWRLVSGGKLPVTENDRGVLQQREWARIAAGKKQDSGIAKSSESEGPRFLSLRKCIAAGRIPAPIFAATVMESGRRVMLTPLDFGPHGKPERAETLTEFLFSQKENKEADLDLWAAARLSATFPWVSPAARAEFPQEQDEKKRRPADHRGQHVIDGGYYDNFGVTSALDWLHRVLWNRISEGTELQFKRVLIIQLRAFPTKDPKEEKPSDGSASALVGPLIGLLNIRSGAAISRNSIELNRFVNAWNERFAKAAEEKKETEEKKVCVATVVFEPSHDEGDGPLSWHLSAKQKENLRNSWQKGENPARVQAMNAYLNGSIPCPPRDEKKDVEHALLAQPEAR
jgi:hypothetical protein